MGDIWTLPQWETWCDLATFTDGSYRLLDDDPKAGWGFVVFRRRCTTPDHHTWCGQVTIDPPHGNFIRATRQTNNAGVLTALFQAVTWARTHVSQALEVLVVSDSKYSINSMQGDIGLTWRHGVYDA